MIGVRCAGARQMIPKQWQRAGESTGLCRQQVVVDDCSKRCQSIACSTLLSSICFFDLLIASVDLGVLADGHIVIHIAFKHPAVPDAVRQTPSRSLKPPHLRLHHLIGDEAVFAFRSWTTREPWRPERADCGPTAAPALLGFFDGDGLVTKQRNVGCLSDEFNMPGWSITTLRTDDRFELHSVLRDLEGQQFISLIGRQSRQNR